MGRHCPLFPTLVSFVSRSCLSLPLLGFSLLCLRSPETPPMLSGVWGAQGPRGWDNCLEYPSHLRQPLPLLIETLCHPWAQVPCPSGRGVSSPCTGLPAALTGTRFLLDLWLWVRAAPGAGLTASARCRQHKPDLCFLLCNSSVVLPCSFAWGLMGVTEHHTSHRLRVVPSAVSPTAGGPGSVWV